jgi:hypothetical protein
MFDLYPLPFIFHSRIRFPLPGSFAMILVGISGALTLERMSIMYNVIFSGNVALLYTAEITASINVVNCTFSVNGTSAVVPKSLFVHRGGKIYVSESVFTGIPLSEQALVSYSGFSFFLFVFYYFLLIIFFFDSYSFIFLVLSSPPLKVFTTSPAAWWTLSSSPSTTRTSREWNRGGRSPQ